MKKSVIKSAKTSDEAIKLALDEIGKKRSEVSVEVLEEGSQGFLGLIGAKDAVVRVSYEEDIEEILEDIKTDLDIEEIKENADERTVEKSEKVEASQKRAQDLEESPKSQKPKKPKEVKEADEEKSEKSEEKPDYALAKKQSNIESYYKAKNLLEEILAAMHFENATVIGNLEGQIIKLDAKVEEDDTGIAIGRQGSTLEAIEFIIRRAVNSRSNKLRINVDINNYKRRRDEKIVDLARDTAKKVIKTKKPWNLRYMNSYERRLAHEEISKHQGVSSHSEGREPQRYVVVDYVGE